MTVTAAPSRAGEARVDWYLMVPTFAPGVLLTAGNASFGFDPPGWLDTFMYLGYFWHYPDHLPLLDDNYKISRLPWILPGFVAHALGGVIAASIALAYLTVAGGAVALYLLVRDVLEDRVAAAVTAVAWACCTWVHGMGGWNYHVVAAADYYLLGCWLIVRAARGRSAGLSAALAGASFAAAVHTHVFFVVFAPLVLGLYVGCLAERGRGAGARLVRAGLFVVLGAIAITVALGAINRVTGGVWLFFMPQIEQAIRLSRPGANQWWLASADQWLPAARYLVLPLVSLVAGLIGLLRFGRQGDWRPAVTLVVLGWGAAVIMGVLQFVVRQTALDYSYLAFALYVHAFPCLAVAIVARRTLSAHDLLTVMGATAAILGTLLFLLPEPLPGSMDSLAASIGMGGLPAILPPIAAGVAGVLITAALPSSARVISFAIWFSLVNAWIAPARTSYGIRTPGIHRDMLVLFRDADRFAMELDPSLLGIKYWISPDTIATPRGPVVLAGVFDSFVATRTWQTNLFARTSPGLPIGDLTLEHLDRATCIGLLSSEESQQKWQAAFTAHYQALGRPLAMVASRRFVRQDLSFALTVLEPVRTGQASPAGRARCTAP